MTTLTASPATPTATATSPYRLSFLRLVRSETIKLATLRSPWWSILVVAVLSVGMSLLLASAFTGSVQGGPGGGPAASASSDLALSAVLIPTSFTVLLAVILGSIQVTGEYSTGMMRSTLTAAPGRIGSLLAKALVVAVFVFVSTVVVFVIALAATAPILSGADMGIDIADLGSWAPNVLAGSFMLAVIALVGVGAGYILRNGPGAIALGVGIVFVLPLVPSFFPTTPDWEWVHTASQYLPTAAGQALMLPSEGSLDPIVAGITLIAWAVVSLGLGAAVLRSRDA
jgi:ABC-2 type transport system permease protein